MSTPLSRWSAAALAGAGVLTVLINAGLTPLMPHGAPFARTAASAPFLWRQSLSALAAALLLVGSIGLYLRQAGRAGAFGLVAFTLALVGSALLLAWEWVDVFVLRELALRAPATLEALESTRGPNLYDLGALIAVGWFTLGWIALAASTLRAERSLRLAAVLVIAGFFATPLLSPLLGPVTAGVVGSGVTGVGWLWLGVGLRRNSAGEVPRPGAA